MKRTQIYIDEDLDAALRSAAFFEGRSAAALIRDAIRAYLEHSPPAPDDDDPILALAGKFSGGPPDAAENHDKYLYGSDPA